MSTSAKILIAAILLAWNNPRAVGATQSSRPTIQNYDEGQRLIHTVAAAFGGAERLSSIRSLKTVAHGTHDGKTKISSVTYLVSPDRMYIAGATLTPGATQLTRNTVVLNADEGWTQNDNNPPARMPPEMHRLAVARLYGGTLSIAYHAGDSRYTFAALGTERLGDIDAIVLRITGPMGLSARWLIDPASALPLRQIVATPIGQPPGEIVTEILGWKKINGILMIGSAHHTFTAADVIEIEYEYELNPAIDMAIFQKPGSTTQPAPVAPDP